MTIDLIIILRITSSDCYDVFKPCQQVRYGSVCSMTSKINVLLKRGRRRFQLAINNEN